MKKIEILFPEIGNLYGDLQNVEYMRRACDEIEIIEDHLTEEPYFVENTPDMIYMGTMTEQSQSLAIKKLLKYKDRLISLIESGTCFLITGNAMEIFGMTIRDEEGNIEECLGIFPIETVRNMKNRFNSLYLGEFKDEKESMKIVGFKSQFSHSMRCDDANALFEIRGDGTTKCLFDTLRGCGMNPDTAEEGIRYKNFMGTYIIGPLTILNPPFTKWLLAKCLEIKNANLPFESEAMDAYRARVDEYSEENRGFYY